ncbi:MAG: alpha/beta hydrolase [Flavobacteriaceae bacterium]|nr:alpha/beta hydrolase [Flavobacteriaceae bacterium]
MKKLLLYIFIGISFIGFSQKTNSIKTLCFPSKDGLPITADIYNTLNAKDFIVLCHQAGFSRGEYINTAKRLQAMGFSALAIDQRSGNKANNILNETHAEAEHRGLSTTYMDAKQDVEAAIDYAYKLNNNKSIVLVGSSYSASLALLVASTNNKVKAVAAFSPGEYLKGVVLAESIKALQKPCFVTSSKSEIKQTTDLVKLVGKKFVTQYKPNVKGIHGSRALWNSTAGTTEYWKAFSGFLSQIK